MLLLCHVYVTVLHDEVESRRYRGGLIRALHVLTMMIPFFSAIGLYRKELLSLGGSLSSVWKVSNTKKDREMKRVNGPG